MDRAGAARQVEKEEGAGEYRGQQTRPVEDAWISAADESVLCEAFEQAHVEHLPFHRPFDAGGAPEREETRLPSGGLGAVRGQQKGEECGAGEE